MCGLWCLLRAVRPAGAANKAAAAAFLRLATPRRCSRMTKIRLGGSKSNVSSCKLRSRGPSFGRSCMSAHKLCAVL
jgi:hypothetical protein